MIEKSIYISAIYCNVKIDLSLLKCGEMLLAIPKNGFLRKYLLKKKDFFLLDSQKKLNKADVI